MKTRKRGRLALVLRDDLEAAIAEVIAANTKVDVAKAFARTAAKRCRLIGAAALELTPDTDFSGEELQAMLATALKARTDGRPV